jgi:CDGSH-type Zn-finger protein
MMARLGKTEVSGDGEVEITPYPNGPFLVRGAETITAPDGIEIELKRRAVAVCRCGRSRNVPFCDGTHKLIGFRCPGSGRDQAGTVPAPKRAE